MSRRKNANEKVNNTDKHREIGYVWGRALVAAAEANVLAPGSSIAATISNRNSATTAALREAKEKLWAIAVAAYEDTQPEKLRSLGDVFDWHRRARFQKPLDPLRVELSAECFRRQNFQAMFGREGETYWRDLTKIYTDAYREEGFSHVKAQSAAKSKVEIIRVDEASRRPRNAAEIKNALEAIGVTVTTKWIRKIANDEFELKLAKRGAPKGKPHYQRK